MALRSRRSWPARAADITFRSRPVGVDVATGVATLPQLPRRSDLTGKHTCNGVREGVPVTRMRPTPKADRRRRVSRLGVAIVAVLLVAGCSGDDDALPDPPSTSDSVSTTSATTTTTDGGGTTSTTDSTPATEPGDPEAGVVLDRYLQFWEARFEANNDPVNPDDPRLTALAADAQLMNVTDETKRRAADGLALRRADKSLTERRPTIVSINGDEATIQDCAVNDDVLYRVATGEVVDDSVVTRSVSATMRRIGGEWKLVSSREVQKWEGVSGCALSSDS